MSAGGKLNVPEWEAEGRRLTVNTTDAADSAGSVHIDGNGHNNAPDNLMLFAWPEEHLRYHFEQNKSAAEARLAQLQAADREYVQLLGWPNLVRLKVPG